MNKRDNFDSSTKDALAKRASFICSNPACKCLTVAASSVDETKFIYTGVAAHITSASEGGPRYDNTKTGDLRADISNAIFLCANCATVIDKNNGVDFSVELLLKWKQDHENWIRDNLNRNISSSLVIIDGEHHAKGDGTVIGLEINRSAKIQPGTISTAEGTGTVIATKIN